MPSILPLLLRLGLSLFLAVAAPLFAQTPAVEESAANVPPGQVRPSLQDVKNGNNLGEGGKLPAVTGAVTLQYPVELKSQGVEGSATVLVVVETDGTVKETVVALSATHLEFAQAAIAYWQAQTFTPATLADGTPVRFAFRRKTKFSLQQEESTGPIVSNLPPIVNDADQPAVVKWNVPPKYPSELQKRGIGGEVVLRFVVDETGRPGDRFEVVSATRPEFVEPSVQALRQWRFTSAKKDGKPVPYTFEQRLRFKVEGGSTGDGNSLWF